MIIKTLKAFLILWAAIFISANAKAQLSSLPYLKNSSLLLGFSTSKMLFDSIYNQDMPKFTFGYCYNYPLSSKIAFDIGGFYSAKGGKSFSEDNFQYFNYFDIPLKANYVFNDMFRLGLGLQGSFLLKHQAKTTGTKKLLEPNPHLYYPNNQDISILGSMDIGLTKATALCFMSSVSLLSSAKVPSLHFWHSSVSLKINFGKTVNRIEIGLKEAHKSEIDFLDLKNGYVLVVLSNRENNVKYYENVGDTQKVNMILRDAKIKNDALKRAFSTKFNFTQVLFIQSNQVGKACARDSSTLLEDAQGNVLQMIKLGEKPYVFFKPGDIYENPNSFNRDGYYFMDFNCAKLYDPFPMLNFATIVNINEIDKLVADLNERLLTREAGIRAKKYFTKNLGSQ